MKHCIICGGDLDFYPDDQIANYICNRCGFMATKEWFDSLTPEQIQEIQDKEAKSRLFRAEQAGKWEAERIKRQMDGIKSKDEIAELLQKHKKIASLDNFYG